MILNKNTHFNFRQLFIRLKLHFVNFIWHVKEERMNFKIFNILKSRQYGIPFLKINKSWKLGFPHLSCLRDISSELGRNLYSRRVFLLEPFNLNWKFWSNLFASSSKIYICDKIVGRFILISAWLRFLRFWKWWGVKKNRV